MPFLIPVFVGTAASGGAAATAGLIGAGGAVTGAGLATGGAMAAMGVGTVMGIQSSRQAGKDAENIAEQQAAIDMANAEETRKSSVVEAQIRAEKGRKLLATQKSQAAAGNIRLNVGSPLVIEEETKQLINQDIGYVLQRGRADSSAFRSSAALSIAQGKATKKQSNMSALSQGLSGFGTMAFMGHQSGLWGSSGGVGNYKAATTPKNLSKINKWMSTP